MVGKSKNTEPILDAAKIIGVIGPRWDFWTLRNMKFYNFDSNGSSCLQDLSHAEHPASTDTGARTYYTSGIYFDPATTPIKLT